MIHGGAGHPPDLWCAEEGTKWGTSLIIYKPLHFDIKSWFQTNKKRIRIGKCFCINGNLCWQSPVGCAAISGWITENMQAYPSQQHETADPHLDGVTFWWQQIAKQALVTTADTDPCEAAPSQIHKIGHFYRTRRQQVAPEVCGAPRACSASYGSCRATLSDHHIGIPPSNPCRITVKFFFVLKV